jgi:GT2 family glycosyltransferase
MKTKVVILNWNGIEFLDNLFKSLMGQTYTDFDIIFVDNGSIDNSIEFVTNNYPMVKIISVKPNCGVAKGYNIGFKEALKDKDMKYILWLNNDVVLDKYAIYELVKALENNKKIGGVSSTIINMNSSKSMSKLTGLIDTLYSFDLSLQHPFCISGCSCMYKREVFEKIGFFDESFFAYYEETDFSWRANKHGWKCKNVLESEVYHELGASFKKLNNKAKYELEIQKNLNWIVSVFKNATIPQKIFFLIEYFRIVISSEIRKIIKKNNVGCKPLLEACKLFITGEKLELTR